MTTGPDTSKRTWRHGCGGSRLHHIRKASAPPFPVDELLALVDVAAAMTKAALEQVRNAPDSFAGPDAALLAALHILVGAAPASRRRCFDA